MSEEKKLEEPVEVEPLAFDPREEHEVTVAIITDPKAVSFGFSPQFPDGIMLYFREGPHALVFKDEAAARLLAQAEAIMVALGMIEVVEDGEELEEILSAPKKKITLH